MVQIGVPTCRMGPPPEPGGPIYPGVSARRFDPASACKVYGDQLMKEMSFNYTAQRLGTKLQHDPNGHDDLAMGDMLPGHRSLASTYNRLGYKLSAVGNFAPPQFPSLTKPPSKVQRIDLSTPSPVRRSRTIARSASVPAAIPENGCSNVSASAPLASRRGCGSGVSASAGSRVRREGRRDAGSTLSANAPSAGQGDASSSLRASAPLDGRKANEEASEVGTNSTFWSLPPMDLSQLSRAAPSSLAAASNVSEDWKARLVSLVKSTQEKPFALL